MTFWETQMAHQPTKEYYEAIKEYFGDTFYKPGLEGKKVLEIGVQEGISTRAFLELGADLHSVDPDLYPNAKEVVKDTGKKWKYHGMKSDEYFKTCKDKFDLIYIDGDHHYKTTKSDLNNAMNHIKTPGIIVVHDFLHNHNFDYKQKKCVAEKGYGITQACCEFLKERKHLVAKIMPPYPGFLIIYIT